MLSESLRPCAPYSVFAGTRANFVGHATSFGALRALLSKLTAERSERFAELSRRRRDGFFDHGEPWHPLPGWFDFLVVDNRGDLRPDLDDVRKICRFFPSSNAFVDQGWNGDVRPRGAPIGGTGRRSPYRYRRHPATQAERRRAFAVAEEGEPPIRGGRKFRELPTYWDDLARTNQRNWKRQRRTQWR